MSKHNALLALVAGLVTATGCGGRTGFEERAGLDDGGPGTGAGDTGNPGSTGGTAGTAPGGTGGPATGGRGGTAGAGGFGGTGAIGTAGRGGGGSGGGGSGGMIGAGGTAGSPGDVLVINPRTTTVPVGQTFRFEVFIQRGFMQLPVTGAVWSVGDAAIGSVSPAGVFTALRPGSTTVRVSSGGQTATATVRVPAGTVSGLNLIPGQATVVVGARQQFRAIAMFSDGTILDVTQWAEWASSDPGIAMPSSMGPGVMMGVAAGRTTIVARFAGAQGTATLNVQAPPTLVRLQVSPADAMAYVDGEQVGYSAIGSYSDGSTRTLTQTSTWSSSNPAVASVTLGRARCLAPGTATITAQNQGMSASATLRCAAPVIVSLVITPAQIASLPVGVTAQFFATATYADGRTRDVSTPAMWTSDNPRVAAVSGRGAVIAIAPGTVTITALFEGVLAKATVTVVP